MGQVESYLASIEVAAGSSAYVGETYLPELPGILAAGASAAFLSGSVVQYQEGIFDEVISIDDHQAFVEVSAASCAYFLGIELPNIETNLASIVDYQGDIKEDQTAIVVDLAALEVLGASIATTNVEVSNKLDDQPIIKNQTTPLCFGGGFDNETDSWRGEHKIFGVLITAEGGGDIVETELIPAIADYKACCLLWGLHSDQTDAAGTITFAAASGLEVGIADLKVATVADEFTPDYRRGLPWKCTAVSENIHVSALAGQFGGAQKILFIGEKWYEPS